ncbi:MAG: hypothetical protein ABH919_04080 [bacterium]
MKLVTKIIGFLLLFFGVATIFCAIYSSYNIFTVKSEVPEIFSVPQAKPSLSQEINKTKEVQSMQDVQNQLQETLKEQMGEMLPADFIPKLLNLVAWSIFASLLIFAGTQLATIGVKLIS